MTRPGNPRVDIFNRSGQTFIRVSRHGQTVELTHRELVDVTATATTISHQSAGAS